MSEKAKLIQLIHIGKQQLNMDEFSYREMVKRLTNKTSSTKCTVVELLKILHEMQQKGAKVKYFAKRGAKPTDYSPATGEARVKSEIAHKIRAVWIEMGKHGFLEDRSEQALNKFIRNMLNRGRVKRGECLLLVYVNTLDQRQAMSVLEALKSWHKRQMITHYDAVLSQSNRTTTSALRNESYENVRILYNRWWERL
ncbi:gp16 family protein [Actinobacillus pleuropneumoniae]|uniref:gp16 family protein n=1 Tax=Actinobacillus pleuropneumoniae TaxID=715 RepID=UPI003511C3ED